MTQLGRRRYVRLALILGICACGGAGPAEPPSLVFAGVPQLLSLHVGGTQELVVTVQDLAGRQAGIPIIYSSADESIASVSSDGLVTAIKVGQTTITAHAQAAHVDIPVHVLSEPLSSVVASPAVVGCPYGVAVGSAGVGYVTSICSGVVYRFDATGRTIGSSLVVGSAPAHVALNPAGTVAYVANQTGQSVSVIEVATNTVTGTIPLSGAEVYNLRVSPDGSRLYVTREDGTLYVIDTATNGVVTTIPVGQGANGLAFNPTKPILYVSAIQSGTVTAINTQSNSVVATFAVGGMPQRIAVSPSGTELYVANETSGLNIIDLSSGAVSSVALGGTAIGLALTTPGDYLYVALANSGTVKIVDTGTHQVYKTIVVGGDPRNMAIAADGTIIIADQTGYLRFIH